ncbi:hypothetical protein GN958_ATG18648 [Phytophthora infestans]|nr:hypothetical protein GN958_ATG18981 [Phytophthora infestans]KAF4132168.1 hypothetical protein GN958_ATG18648 [Phytophthora infestans]
MLPVAPFGPDAAFIPGRRAPVAFAARDIEPWSAKKLNRVAIISMKITVLFPELPFGLSGYSLGQRTPSRGPGTWIRSSPDPSWRN